MAAPNTFSDKTGQIALTLLDENFEYVDTSLTTLNSSLTTNVSTLQTSINAVQTNLDNIDLTNIVGNTTVTGSLTTTDVINFGNTALIASNAETNNIDHIWHDDAPSALGAGGTWHFCSDTTYRATGNSTLRAASIDTDYISSTSMQVVSTVYTGKTTYAFATAGTLGTYIAVLDTTITPTKTSSKVRVEFNLTFECHQDTVFRLWRVINGATTEVVRNSDTNYWSGFAVIPYDANNASTVDTNHYVYIDSPNTTSAVTYRLMIQSGGVGANTLYLNRSVSADGQQNYENGVSQCILTEIPV